MTKTEGAPQRPMQLTLVSTEYVSRILRTVAHVRSIASGRTVSMSEVFRDLVMSEATDLELEVAKALGEDKASELRALRARDVERQ